MKYPVGPLYSPLAGFDTLIHQTLEDGGEQRDNLSKLTVACCNNKNLIIQPKAFGIPLTKLVKKTFTEFSVPFVLMRICHFIEEKGADKIDLSRRSKNTQLVESLRIAFDETGNAPLEAECDVSTATVLLEIFLHQLPDPIIPKDTLPAYVLAVQDIQKDKEGCILKLKGLVEKLPLDNFNTLKFITQFIFRVNQKYSEREEIMIMGFSLGSKIFRLAYEGDNHKNQLVCNLLMELLVYDYNIIFENGVDQLYDDKPLRRKCNDDDNTLDAQDSEVVASAYSFKSVASFCSASADPSVNLKPLSIIIPPMEKYDAEDVSLEARVPTLLVDSVVQSFKEPLVKCLDMHTIQQQSLPHQGRKRKERRPSKEECLLIQSSFVERKSADPVMFWELSQNISQDETRIMVSSDTKIIETREPSVSITKWRDHLGSMLTAELSPHPPLAKRQELESFLELEYKIPIQDIVGQSDSLFETCNVSEFHEVQRSAERMAPLKQPLYQKSMHTVNNVMDKQLKPKSESCENQVESDVRKNNSYFGKVPVKTCKNSVTKMEESCKDSFKENYERKKFPSDRLHTQPNSKYHVGCDKYGHYLPMCKHGSHQGCERIPALQSGSKLSHPLLEVHPVNTVDANYYSDDDTSNENTIPSFDFTFSSDREDVQEPVLSEHRHSWPLTTSGLEDPMLSPSFYHLKKTNSFEASLSLSAGICLPHLRSLDPNIPPSSPKDQHVFTNRVFKNKDKITSSIKQLTKKIHKLKKKIRHFEENFEGDYGFRPSHADKMNYPEVKKMMTELNKLRKDLKGVREEQQLEQDSGDYIFTRFVGKSGTVGHSDLSDSYKFPMEKVLDKGKAHLSEEKCIANVPETVEGMTTDQMLKEELDIQRDLLRFERTPGRPLTDNQKEITHPLYDRCRNVKRMSGRISVFGNSLGKEPGTELQPILEHVAMDFKSPERSGSLGQIENSPSNLTEASPSALLPQEEHACAASQKGQAISKHEEKSVTAEFNNSNFHELSLPELLQQRRQTRLEKRRLRRILREFEEEFQQKNGRKVQKEDKISVEPVYSEYKHTKGKLKLLEALVTKHELHHRI
ncbi:protein FAM13B-like isoform X2 [Limulus polyphemus]|uniref:Protein FAM13B-like isoform X2 n=1 Tax=Limulus polyphemus TaxID=6850 RepID=A0ABM1BRM6_LIMPO|nr:protein FAM13B-like isoform X2 [Limulus polyphemus]